MPITRLSDAKLVQMAKQAEGIDEKVQALLLRKEKIQETVMKELERRKTRVLEHDGIKLTRVQAERTEIDWDELMSRLKVAQKKLCTKKVPDRKGLEAAMAAGLIDVQVVAECSEIKKNTPYLVVTPVRPG